MASLNKAQLIGHLGRDPEVKELNSGDEVCTLSLATSESWTDKKTGERREATEWHRVVIFNQHLVKVAKEYLRKGTQLYVEGQIKTRKWADKDGIDRYSTEIVLPSFGGTIVMLGGKRDSDGEPETSGNARQNSRREEQQQGGGHHYRSPDLNDDIPFAPEWRV